jgi:SAM-dependent methyltransferase
LTQFPAHDVHRAYDRWATVYDHDANPMVALEEPAFREAVGDSRGLAVLDMGCGTGRHALWLARAGAKVTAIDFSEGMLAVAKGIRLWTPFLPWWSPRDGRPIIVAGLRSRRRPAQRVAGESRKKS